MHRRILLSITLAAIAVVTLAADFGDFIGQVRVEWCDDGRAMRLLEDFSYRDPGNHVWVAPTASVVDGASIPKVFWSHIGGPFEGKYRTASVVHDVACVRRDVDWKKTHRMFYYACRRAGVSETKAKIMFAAVHHFGPRWKKDATPLDQLECHAQSVRNSQFQAPVEPETVFTSETDYFRLKTYIEQNPGVSLDHLENLTVPRLRKVVPTARRPVTTLNQEIQ